jgi:hypothetical protein
MWFNPTYGHVDLLFLLLMIFALFMPFAIACRCWVIKFPNLQALLLASGLPSRRLACSAPQGSCCYVDLDGLVILDAAVLEQQLREMQTGASTKDSETVQLLEIDHVWNSSAQHNGGACVQIFQQEKVAQKMEGKQANLA